MTREYNNDGRDQYNIENVQGNLTFNHTQIIQISIEDIINRPLNTTSPYKGLRYFEVEDKALFFGRDQFLTGLVNELEQTHLILLLGASGSGKSSVVRAGLIPWLKEKHGNNFVHLIFKPDQAPFKSLYASLLGKYRQTEAQIALTAKTDTLTRIVTSLKQQDSYWFILIDQFEELFTITQSDERDTFIASLMELLKTLAKTGEGSVKIMATMRADFLDRLDPYPDLVKVTQKHRPMIPKMELDELRLVIEQPAAQHGVVFEPGLVEQIIGEVQGQKVNLPLLQYTLNLLWNIELQTSSLRARRLYSRTYRNLGGVRGALQERVSRFYENLSKEEQLATQRIFLKLVGIGEDKASETDWKPIRRRANRSQFTAPLEQHVLSKLIDEEKLLVSDREPETQQSTIELAHEVLLTAWTTLNGWIRENREAIALRNRLDDDVTRWQAKKAEDELWGGSKLEQALEFRKDETFNQVLGGFQPEANRFIDASLGKREHQRRKTKIFLSVFSAVASALALIAYWYYLDATKQKVNAELKALSLSSEKLFFNDKKFDALLVGLRAGKQVIEQSDKVTEDTRIMVITTLEQAINKVSEFNRLEGSPYSINSVSFIKDGNVSEIASSSDDGNITIWNLQGKPSETRKVPWSKSRPTSKLTNTILSFDPVHQRIVTASNEYDPESKTSYSTQDGVTGLTEGKLEGFISLWQLKGTGLKFIKTWKAHTDRINSISFVLEGNAIAIASASDDKTIKLWHLDGRPIRTLNPQYRVQSISFSPISKRLVSSSEDGYLSLWRIDRMDNDKPQKTWKASDDLQAIKSLAFSPNGQTIASGGRDTMVKLWNIEGSPLKFLGKHLDEVNSVSFSSNGQIIASTGKDGIIKLWKTDGTLLMSLQGHSDEVNSISFSPDDSILASASTDNTVKLWSLRKKPQTQKILNQGDGVNSVSFSPDKQKIITVGEQGSIKLWHRDGNLWKTLAEEGEGITSVSFSPDSKIVITGDLIGNIKLWDTEISNLSKPKLIKAHKEQINSVSFSPNGQIIASASNDKTIKLWKVADRSLQKTLKEHTEAVNGVSFSPDGKLLASASSDSTIKLWKIVDGSLLRTFKGHTDVVNNISFSPNGKVLVSTSRDTTIKLWKVADGALQRTFKGHQKYVNSANFSPDGKVVVSGGDDTTVKFWSVDDGSEIKTLQGHQSEITTVSFSPDGSTIASASKDGKTILWNLNLSDLIKQSCSWLSDYLRNPNVVKSDRSLCPLKQQDR